MKTNGQDKPSESRDPLWKNNTLKMWRGLPCLVESSVNSNDAPDVFHYTLTVRQKLTPNIEEGEIDIMPLKKFRFFEHPEKRPGYFWSYMVGRTPIAWWIIQYFGSWAAIGGGIYTLFQIPFYGFWLSVVGAIICFAIGIARLVTMELGIVKNWKETCL